MNSLGGRVRTFEVALTHWAMQARHWPNWEEAITRANNNDGAGRLNSGEEALIVREKAPSRIWMT